jgi:hypothetical protein
MGDLGYFNRKIVIMTSAGTKSRMGNATISLVRSFDMMANRVLLTDAPESFTNSRLSAPYRYKYKMHRCSLTETNYIGDAGVVYEVLGVNQVDMLFMEAIVQKIMDLNVPEEIESPEGNQGSQGSQGSQS